MKAFEYAAPRQEAGLLELLSAESGHTEVLAGGTDLIGLMKRMIVTPRRVVNLKEVDTLRGIAADSQQVTIGAVTTLEEIADHPALADFPAVTGVIRQLGSMQWAAQGTLGGELCQRPRCWYFRNGHGLLASNRLVEAGQNRHHAILGNTGPAKYVCPSRLAPALVALGATARMIGPRSEDESWVPLEAFFRVPRHEGQRETILQPNQVLAQIVLPVTGTSSNATYEVRHGLGPEAPWAAASAALSIRAGVVADATIVLGQVAPIPWLSTAAAKALLGHAVTRESARAAGEAAVAGATPLSQNRYKVQLARVAVERAVLLAAGLDTGGF